MKIMPMGDYYVWHCDWCDSTNYTVWTRIEKEGFTCAACQQKISEFADSSATFNNRNMSDNRLNSIAL